MSYKTSTKLSLGLVVSMLISSGCATAPSNLGASPAPSAPTLSVPPENNVYQAVWVSENPGALYRFVSGFNREGQATFTFIVRSDGSVAGITKEQVLPEHTDVREFESYLKTGHFAPVYKHAKPIASYQTYTFYYGDNAYLQYWRETCEHEGNRDNPPSGSTIIAVPPRYCTRVQYPGFLAYRFLLWPAPTVCSSERNHCNTGQVELLFKLDGDGHSRDVTVYKTDAGDLIELAAKKAVENWYFVPMAGHELDTKVSYAIVIVF